MCLYVLQMGRIIYVFVRITDGPYHICVCTYYRWAVSYMCLYVLQMGRIIYVFVRITDGPYHICVLYVLQMGRVIYVFVRITDGSCHICVCTYYRWAVSYMCLYVLQMGRVYSDDQTEPDSCHRWRKEDHGPHTDVGHDEPHQRRGTSHVIMLLKVCRKYEYYSVTMVWFGYCGIIGCYGFVRSQQYPYYVLLVAMILFGYYGD